MNNPAALSTNCWIVGSSGHGVVLSSGFDFTDDSFLRKKMDMSWLTVGAGMLCSTKSWYASPGKLWNPSKMGVSGLLVTKTRSRIVSRHLACASSFRISWISSLLSHSSRASITTTSCIDWAGAFFRGSRMRCFHCSLNPCFTISKFSSIAFEINGRRTGRLLVSWAAIVVKNWPAWLISPRPREKKKLAASLFFSAKSQATVREIVDFPVPAIPLSQKIHSPSGSSNQSIIFWRSSTLVSGKQRSSCSQSRWLYAAPSAFGSLKR